MAVAGAEAAVSPAEAPAQPGGMSRNSWRAGARRSRGTCGACSSGSARTGPGCLRAPADCTRRTRSTRARTSRSGGTRAETRRRRRRPGLKHAGRGRSAAAAAAQSGRRGPGHAGSRDQADLPWTAAQSELGTAATGAVTGSASAAAAPSSARLGSSSPGWRRRRCRFRLEVLERW